MCLRIHDSGLKVLESGYRIHDKPFVTQSVRTPKSKHTSYRQGRSMIGQGFGSSEVKRTDTAVRLHLVKGLVWC